MVQWCPIHYLSIYKWLLAQLLHSGFVYGRSCQDVSSLGNNLSRCVIFRQVARYYCLITNYTTVILTYCCQEASSLGSNLSGCVIFRQVVSLFMAYAIHLCISLYDQPWIR